MKKYHVATGDGKGYYGVGYESYRQAEILLKISQEHDPQAHIVEEEYHFTNADRIRAMNDEELAKTLINGFCCHLCKYKDTNRWDCPEECEKCCVEWLKQPAEVPENG